MFLNRFSILLTTLLYVLCESGVRNIAHSVERTSRLNVRKNVNSLSYKEWNEFKRGIKLMKERSAHNKYDPLGFNYQANIHGWPDFDGSEKAQQMAKIMNWHQCQHGHYFFIVWHRMYIYFFEKILQKVTNNPELTIPFWDAYEPDSRSLPQPFRIPANNRTNPLYISERCKNINEGKPLSGRVVNPYPVLNTNFFTTFKQNNELNLCHSLGGGRIDEPSFLAEREGLIERIPHDNLHLFIGGPKGYMSDLCKSARDPTFLVHHSATDRLWESWLKAGGTNDMEEQFINQTFDFFDETGDLGSYRVGDFLDTKALGYVYESYIKSDPVEPNKNERPKLYLPIDEREDLTINQNKHFITLNMKPQWNQFFLKYTNRQFDGLDIKFTLQFDVEFLQPDMIFEMYLNLHHETIPYDNHPNFLGHMVTFEEHCVESFWRQKRSINKCFDITKELKKILNNGYNFDGYLPQTFNLTFIPKYCDKVVYPDKNADAIRFNEIIIVFFRKDEIQNNYETLALEELISQKKLFDNTLSTAVKSERLPVYYYQNRLKNLGDNINL